MANKKVTELVEAASVLETDIVPVVVDPAGSAATKKATIATLAARILTALNATGGATIADGGIAVTGNSSVAGTLVATLFSGSGASLTSLPSSALTGALPAISGASLTGLSATNITTGTLPAARVTTLNATTLDGALTFSLNAGAARSLIVQSGGYAFPGTQQFASIGADYDHSGAVTPVALGQAPTGTGAYRWRWVHIRYVDSGGANRAGYWPILTES